MDRLTALTLVLFAGCKAPLPEGPVCGLHSASAPVMVGDHTLGVGAKVNGTDLLNPEGWALLECFTGGISVLHRMKIRAGEMKEARIEIAFPRSVLKGDQIQQIEALPRPVVARYSDNRFTPENARKTGEDDTNYFKAFFTPNGFAEPPTTKMNLPPPPNRARVPFIHAGDLGDGDRMLEVKDGVVFAETDDLATAALVEGKTYRLGRTVRLVLPDGAMAKLGSVKIEGPIDLSLR